MEEASVVKHCVGCLQDRTKYSFVCVARDGSMVLHNPGQDAGGDNATRAADLELVTRGVMKRNMGAMHHQPAFDDFPIL